MAPIDILHGLSKDFIEPFPDDGLPSGLKEQALDLEFFWVSEKGPQANSKLTAGLRAAPTVSFYSPCTLRRLLD